MPTLLDDYRWLVEERGAHWLAIASSQELPIHTLADRLRRDLSQSQTRLVLDQVQLRARAATKFPQAGRMFFTKKLLEQASGQSVARHKANRISDGSKIVDLCCGIGGDLIALASRGPVTGIDRDELAAYLAAANCAALGITAEVVAIDVQETDVRDYQAVHLDPDRRPSGHRSVRLEHHEPSRELISRLVSQASGMALKLAPATDAHDELLKGAELEWIGARRECRQLVAWFGSVARHVGRRVATVVTSNSAQSLVGRSNPPPHTTRVEAFIYEPHAAVLAAELAGEFAAQQGLKGLTARGGYLTGSALLNSPFATGYEVNDVMPYRPKRIRQALRLRRIGRLAVKKRGVDLQPERIERECNPRAGDESAVLVVARIEKRTLAILTRPVNTDTTRPQRENAT